MGKFFHQLGCSVLLWFTCSVYGVTQEFIIEDIRIEGLQHITAGTVFSFFPLKAGDSFVGHYSAGLARSLFKTGFFEDIRIERDGNILVLIFKERPAIGSITISGNNDIDSSELLDNLAHIDFAEGRIFVQSKLEQVRRELQQQYFALGKYTAKITTSTRPMDDGRIAISIDIYEGSTTKIKKINIVGNTRFSEKKLLKQFSLSDTTFFSFLTKKDQYSKQKLIADLEKLRSFYLDRGYLKFDIESSQVAITADKKRIYITINIHEGEQYKISEIKVGGTLLLPQGQLLDLIVNNPGQFFSRKMVNESRNNIVNALGNEGYAFAKVNAIPEVDQTNKTVNLTFFVDPGNRAYVRRINFSGNYRTRDDVLRREMRQQESAWFSTRKIEMGKLRLQRLGFFSEVSVETPLVPGSIDQIDVNYTVEERASGNINLGLGYAQEQGLVIQTSISQNNFLGSGKRVAFSFNNSDVNQIFHLSYTDPYYTIDGVSLGYNLTYREVDAGNANLTSFDLREVGGGIRLGFPVSERQTLFTAVDYKRTKIQTNEFSSQEVIDFQDQNGDRFDILKFSASFRYDSRNRSILADTGVLGQLGGEISIPGIGHSLEYYKLDLQGQWYKGLYRDLILLLKSNIGYGDGYAGTSDLPFFENFYAGGPKTVRGYSPNTLGPRDSENLPIGGALKVINNIELIFPLPFLREVKAVRISNFLDIGNVFEDISSFDVDELRYAAGMAIIWISPFGQINASIAKPLNDREEDDVQQFQFSFGASF